MSIENPPPFCKMEAGSSHEFHLAGIRFQGQPEDFLKYLFSFTNFAGAVMLQIF